VQQGRPSLPPRTPLFKPPDPLDVRKVDFPFRSAGFQACRLVPVELQQVFRQSDRRFIDLLNGVRVGGLEPWMAQLLRELQRPLPADDGVQATKLMPTRRQAERINAEVGAAAAPPGSWCLGLGRLGLCLRWHLRAAGANGPTAARVQAALCHRPLPALLDSTAARAHPCRPPQAFRALPGEARRYAALDVAPERFQRYLAELQAPEELELKEGAQVVLLHNLDVQQGLANGSRGVVLGFASLYEYIAQEVGRGVVGLGLGIQGLGLGSWLCAEPIGQAPSPQGV
jgi:hypothetical protein